MLVRPRVPGRATSSNCGDALKARSTNQDAKAASGPELTARGIVKSSRHNLTPPGGSEMGNPQPRAYGRDGTVPPMARVHRLSDDG